MASTKAKRTKKTSKKKKVGRPTKFNPEQLEMVEKLVALGHTQDDLAYLLDVAPSTIGYWKQHYPEFSEALKKGEAKRKSSLLRHLWKLVQAGNSAVTIFLAKNWLGMKDKTEFSGDLEQEIKINVVKATKKEVKNNGSG